MISTFVMSVTGFVFWIVNTRIYTPEQIGLATTFISVTTLIISFSMAGLNIAVVRFLPRSKQKNALINTVFSLVVILTFIITCIFLVGIHYFSEPMEKLLANPIYILLFIPFVLTASLNMITDSVFISYGKALYIMTINIVMSLSKLALAFVFAGLGVMGIISSFSVSTVVAMCLSFFFLIKWCSYSFNLRIKKELVKEMWKFSFGNYMSSILSSITSLLTPLLITSKLSPEITAYYYMPTMIVTLLLSVPRSTVSSLIAEGSREEEPLFKLAFKSLLHVYAILIPGCIATLVLGKPILSVFGKNYSNGGFTYLLMLLASVLIAVPGFIIGATLSVNKKIKLQFILNLISAVLSLSLNIFFLNQGLYGLGLAAIIYQVIITIIYLCVGIAESRVVQEKITLARVRLNI